MNKDLNILKRLQSDFPLTRRPFNTVSKRFGLSEEELIGHVGQWKEKGLIRYFGAIFDTQRLGICSTLIAMPVKSRSIKRIVSIINQYPEVTHNYLRDDDHYNLWFTLSASSKKELAKLIKAIKAETGITDILDLRKTTVFKKRAVFS